MKPSRLLSIGTVLGFCWIFGTGCLAMISPELAEAERRNPSSCLAVKSETTAEFDAYAMTTTFTAPQIKKAGAWDIYQLYSIADSAAFQSQHILHVYTWGGSRASEARANLRGGEEMELMDESSSLVSCEGGCTYAHHAFLSLPDDIATEATFNGLDFKVDWGVDEVRLVIPPGYFRGFFSVADSSIATCGALR